MIMATLLFWKFYEKQKVTYSLKNLNIKTELDVTGEC